MQKPSAAIWSVSALNFEIKTMLEKGIGTIWIEGEISNLARPASGHWYFSLKDNRAQLRAAMFKNRNGRVSFKPENGQQVLVRAQVTLYEARGEYQVIIDHMEEAGTGLLMQQYEALKKKLSAEGLFDASRKKKIPAQARHIGLITSASGAAIRDALSVIERRSPQSEVTVIATPVQGEQATPQIVRAIQQANRFAKCDVILLIRGGGSLEDLWCFNEEAVARAMYESKCPIVTGIGHEIDFTIADFVADFRAPTPSVAAETVTMDQYEVMTRFDILSARLTRQMQVQLLAQFERLMELEKRLYRFHPRRSMENLKQRMEFALARLKSFQTSLFVDRQNRLNLAMEQFSHYNPKARMLSARDQLDNLEHHLLIAMKNRLELKRHQFKLQARTLDNMSPLKTLSRGFATVIKNKALISSVTQLKSDDAIEIRFKDGEIRARTL
jgi:exodeoxyribonuclease VII large subunit